MKNEHDKPDNPDANELIGLDRLAELAADPGKDEFYTKINQELAEQEEKRVARGLAPLTTPPKRRRQSYHGYSPKYRR